MTGNRASTPVMDAFRIRPANVEDIPLIFRLICELAEYEGLLPEVAATETLLREALFGDRPRAEALIGEVAGIPAGFAVYFHNFSTFLARPGLYVEDVFVRPEYRVRGLGRAFFVHLARLARERGCGRMEWAVLDWNEGALRFYRGIGARAVQEWTLQRLDEKGIASLADGPTPTS